MALANADDKALQRLIKKQHSVLRTTDARAFLTKNELQWRIASGRWQAAGRGVVVAHSGPFTDEQFLRITLYRWGPKAALAGLTAARIDQFTGFDDKLPVANGPVYVLAVPSAKKRPAPAGLNVIVHRSRRLGDEDVHPLREPRRTRIARSLVDAAEWRATDRGAMAILAAGVQQGLTRVSDMRAVILRPGPPMRRRALMLDTLGDIEGGAQALSELDFTQKVIKQFGLPEPSRQVGRRDSRGKQRWIDVVFEPQKTIVEIDGAQHSEPLQRWDDMRRDNDLGDDGYRVLRFPAWLVRKDPRQVADKIREALRQADRHDSSEAA